MATIFMTTISNVFLKKNYCILRVWLTKIQHQFGQSVDVKQATCHDLKRCWVRCLTPYGMIGPQWVNTLRARQNGRHFTDDPFKLIFFNRNVQISIKISLKFVPEGPMNNIPALVQIMAWRRTGDKPLSEPMIVTLPTHLCVTRPQWVKPERN